MQHFVHSTVLISMKEQDGRNNLEPPTNESKSGLEISDLTSLEKQNKTTKKQKQTFVAKFVAKTDSV